MEARAETPPEPYLAEMPITRDQRRLRVRIYPPPPDQSEDDPRRFIVRDSKGNEIGIEELSLKERALAETLVFGKPEAQTYHKLELQERNDRKRRPSSPTRTSRPY